MSGLNHLFLVVRMRVFSIFPYHSTRPNNDKNTPVMAVMDTIPKIAIDQKISFRFFLLLSISCCFCDCLSISLTICGSNPPVFLDDIYCSLIDGLRACRRNDTPGPQTDRQSNPPMIQLFVVCNKSVVFFLLNFLTIGSKCREYIQDFSSSNPSSFVFLPFFCGEWPCYSSYFLR